MDFAKDHKEVYDKTSEYLKNTSLKECLWEHFAGSRNLCVKVCKTWFESKRTHYRKLTQSKSDQVPKEKTKRQNWIKD